MKTVGYVALIATVIYGALCALLFFTQDQILYQRTPEVDHPEAHALRVRCGDATLKVWELHANAQPALIYFGGNAEDVSANLPEFRVVFPDRAVYLVNYRGYGGSTGQPSEAALISDAEAVYDWVASGHDHIVVIGRSLGSGVATALAARRPVERLILVTPYDSIANVDADHFPWVPARWLIKDRYDSVRRIGKVHVPILLLVAERDEVIYRARSDALSAAIPAPIRHTILLKGASHNDLSLFPAYLQNLREFAAAAYLPTPEE
jgi:pimeloyl-ACP methyl ester carboxylesterase